MLVLAVLGFAPCPGFAGFEEQGTLSGRSSWLLTAGDQLLWSRALAALELCVGSRPQASAAPRHTHLPDKGSNPDPCVGRWVLSWRPLAAASQESPLDESLLVVSHERLRLLKHLGRTLSASLIRQLGSLRAVSFPWAGTKLNAPADLTELLPSSPCRCQSGASASCGGQCFLLSQLMFNPLPKLV